LLAVTVRRFMAPTVGADKLDAGDRVRSRGAIPLPARLIYLKRTSLDGPLCGAHLHRVDAHCAFLVFLSQFMAIDRKRPEPCTSNKRALGGAYPSFRRQLRRFAVYHTEYSVAQYFVFHSRIPGALGKYQSPSTIASKELTR
jgi:hypothetical protein